MVAKIKYLHYFLNKKTIIFKNDTSYIFTFIFHFLKYHIKYLFICLQMFLKYLYLLFLKKKVRGVCMKSNTI